MRTKPAAEVLALIPARSGSKRVKNKNVRMLGTKPLIAYTIEAALEAELTTRVIVTTDSERIARVVRRFGAEAPFLRPRSIAAEHSTEYEFHLHALTWLKEEEGYEPDLVVNLYPTTPFRKASSIDRAVRLMLDHPEADCLRSVRKCSEHPYKMWVREDVFLNPFVPSKDLNSHTSPYHLLPEVFIQNASIYITRPRVILEQGSTLGKKILAFEMGEIESLDINTPLDFLAAETLVTRVRTDSGSL